MVFFSTYINYTTRVNMSIAIVSMTGGKETKEAECLTSDMSTKQPETIGENITTTKMPLPDVSFIS